MFGRGNKGNGGNGSKERVTGSLEPRFRVVNPVIEEVKGYPVNGNLQKLVVLNRVVTIHHIGSYLSSEEANKRAAELNSQKPAIQRIRPSLRARVEIDEAGNINGHR
ncbi:hypothetical protein A3A76_01385 [Candidatus Woesebacteria bacterium RIFCSPLOWO2_01_FULL_39_23]|uniref:Uncharacterized protein n=1 Tax=Candidatus Woesebacteria bacterium RIFCSPHIGHO2_01_FULL_40_22 TaxID=1802499 RepID=A0A1F7YGM4_9BACT|nr:MAG: hypothetical protein A2141_04985 [Candidatus Woesebacteria bacterium RBG_16_40_11]OGM26477.1 MAG: hypothetical protein A2628_02980 [Candidatus Woesebacteria bacterium RIFCSPHIGHO2_01_FULL_40_22]OGM37646.1 MAG: hypothetical protein A3E41_05500 [Candidatus Woesebacteria bacterium RIFCSPHIGHO2_12_FULL_38_9]OGM62930.1 MAG: hypothetical protein A3A76_01385 [Candidatus Woesebacteria bacterium RIFCSPLOWO2_01_FULL_39_23]